MNFFYFIIFGIAILLIGISVPLYLIFKRGEIILNYNCYVFSIFWTPASCGTKNTGKNECFQLIKKLKNEKYFTLHGLWPSVLSGEIPESCNSGDDIIPNFEDDNDNEFKEKLEILWPGLYSNNTYLWTNEYNKHGYCYIKRNHYNVIDDYKIYFNICMNMFEKGYRDLMEQMLPDSKGVYNVSKEKFRNLLKKTNLNITDYKTYSLLCDNSTKQLKEIRFTLDLNLERVALEKSQESCPDIFILNFTDEEKIPVYDKYDFYVLSITYGASACKVNGKKCYEILNSKKNNKFVLHGLWPSYKNGNIPQICNIDVDIPIKYDNGSEYFNNIKEYWYTLYTTDEIFWTHEYNNHGYCYIKRINESVNDYKIYFNKALDIYQNNFLDLFDYLYKDYSEFPREFIMNKTYLLSKLDERYSNNAYYLSCKKFENKYYLDEIRFKLDMEFNFTSEGNFTDNCPQEFMVEIMERPREKYKTNEEVWKTYDIYVFSMFFQTTTCRKKGFACYIAIENFPKNIWTIHGLWPNYKNGTIPGWCNGDNDIDIKIKNQSLYDYMKIYWPGLFRTNEGFWGHEYNRHGYCYNQRFNINVNNYEQFFLKGIEIYEKYDLGNIFINMYDKNLPKGDNIITRTKLEGYLKTKGIERDEYLLICENITINNKNYSYIYEMRIRFDLDFNLYKNETEKLKEECPEEFMAEFL